MDSMKIQKDITYRTLWYSVAFEKKQNVKGFSQYFCFKLRGNMRIKNVYYFLLPISRESIVFESKFRNGDFDGFTRFEVP